MVVMVEGFKTPGLEGLAEAFRTQDMLLVSVLNREPTTWPPQLRHMTLTKWLMLLMLNHNIVSIRTQVVNDVSLCETDKHK